VIIAAAESAARRRGCAPVVHATEQVIGLCGAPKRVSVTRADGTRDEESPVVCGPGDLGHEFEWEENPEFHVHVVADVAEAVALFNGLAPRFIVSCISDDDRDHELVWEGCDAPFVGDGFTRWVDGQFALLRPELGLSNWQGGRLFARSAVLSGDSAYSVRLRVRQQDPGVHR
jgi:glutamate-5-semialdehyde dehydrogenase